VPTVLSLVSSAASVFASSLGQFMDSALHCLASQSGAFTVCVLFASFIMHYALLRALSFDLINSGEHCALQLTQPIIFNETIMNHPWSSAVVNRQASILNMNYESIMKPIMIMLQNSRLQSPLRNRQSHPRIIRRCQSRCQSPLVNQ
jgi:hypothetical protein